MIQKIFTKLGREYFLLLSYGSVLLFSGYSTVWIGAATGIFFGGLLFFWLFLVMLFSSFAVVRHADVLAKRLGEPYGTLILTLSAISIEVVMIAAFMLKGSSPTLVRSTMFSVIMIMLCGVLGGSLLIGGLRFHEQKFNLKGAKAFMGLILPLSLFSLVMPNFTKGDVGYFSPLHSVSVVVLSLMLYGLFLGIQTYWHQAFFIEPRFTEGINKNREPLLSGILSKRKNLKVVLFHTGLLVLYIMPVIILSKKLALLLNLKQQDMAYFMPTSTRVSLQGFIVAILVLAPEGLAALRAAWNNQVQRSVNLLLGSVLATIGLTVPAAIGLGLYTGQAIHMGLNPAGITLLAVTLGSSIITFSQGETNLLQGAIHIFLFIAYILLMFQ